MLASTEENLCDGLQKPPGSLMGQLLSPPNAVEVYKPWVDFHSKWLKQISLTPGPEEYGKYSMNSPGICNSTITM